VPDAVTKQNRFIHKTHDIKESMPRPRTPTAVLALRGAFKRNPNRLAERKYEPIVTTPLPEPPNRLRRPVKGMWRQMQSHGHWLTSADKYLVEIAAALMARYRSDELKSADASLLIGLLGKIGFSPKERGSMNLPTRST
jgi:hypothetical protein